MCYLHICCLSTFVIVIRLRPHELVKIFEKQQIEICISDAFPNVHKTLHVMSVLPVTTTTNERSFSTLSWLKTYLQSIMGKDCINELATLNIHCDINVDIHQALNKFFSNPCQVNLFKQLFTFYSFDKRTLYMY